MERVKVQADLKKLQSYRSSLETYKTNLENKASELSDELENTSKYKKIQDTISQFSGRVHWILWTALVRLTLP